jgi:hypothetical protein
LVITDMNTAANSSDTAAADAAESSAGATLRLPEFWPDKPAAWFVFAESKFRLKNIISETVRFDLLVSSLPRDSIRQVIDVVAAMDETAPYTVLKERLLSSHELSDFQKIERLFQMDMLARRKPSELMSHMLELCPRGEEKNKFFLFLFMQRLPKELRVMLTEEDHKEPRDLATKADQHWAMLSHQSHGMVAALSLTDSKDSSINAVQHAGRGRYQRGRGRGGAGRGRGCGGAQQQQQQLQQQDGQASNAALHPTAPGTLARFSTGLCHFHWTFGDQARKCEVPCSWGN